MMTEPISHDAELLLTRARGGDADDLGRLLEHYRRYLKLLARVSLDRRVQGKLDPSDIVQETVLQAYRDFASFRGASEPEFAEWLRAIMAFRCANAVRHYLGTRRRDVRLERQIAGELDQSSRALVDVADAESSPSLHAEHREQAVRLADALEQLPAHYRQVMILHHLEGLSMTDVGRRLGRSLDSVRKIWARALVRLRHLLKEDSL